MNESDRAPGLDFPSDLSGGVGFDSPVLDLDAPGREGLLRSLIAHFGGSNHSAQFLEVGHSLPARNCLGLACEIQGAAIAGLVYVCHGLYLTELGQQQARPDMLPLLPATLSELLGSVRVPAIQRHVPQACIHSCLCKRF